MLELGLVRAFAVSHAFDGQHLHLVEKERRLAPATDPVDHVQYREQSRVPAGHLAQLGALIMVAAVVVCAPGSQGHLVDGLQEQMSLELREALDLVRAEIVVSRAELLLADEDKLQQGLVESALKVFDIHVEARLVLLDELVAIVENDQ